MRINPDRSWLRTAAGAALLLTALPAVSAEDRGDAAWNDALRSHYFKDQSIVESEEVVTLEVPYRAEDAALVPLRIKANIPQTEDLYIKTVTLIIDKNPAPIVGRFHFTPRSGRADLAMRVRINEYSPVRAIAETSDGRLTMSRRFVKASGGCSAPVGTDLDAALKRLGRIKFRVDGQSAVLEPVQAQLKISHPNITGMQMDQVTRTYEPAHFVKQVRVDYAGEPIFWAETDISVSENPNFRFYFVPEQPGRLTAEVTDNKGNVFEHTYSLGPGAR